MRGNEKPLDKLRSARELVCLLHVQYLETP